MQHRTTFWWTAGVALAVAVCAAPASAQLVGLRGGWHQAPFNDFPDMIGPAALLVIAPVPWVGLRAGFASAEGTRSPMLSFCDSPAGANCVTERARVTGSVEILELGVMAFAPTVAQIRFGAALTASRHDLKLDVVSRESARRQTVFAEGLPTWGTSASLSADAPLPFARRFFATVEVQRSWYDAGECLLDAWSLCGDVRSTAVYAGLSYRLFR